ncbi:hypothetical protein [Nocardia sp. NPDC003345]
MSRFVKFALITLVAAIFGLGPTQLASADVSVRNATASDLYVRDESPGLDQLERMYAAFYNPNISLDHKVAVSQGGEKVRPVLEQQMAYSTSLDFFSIQGRAIGPVVIEGDTLTVTGQGLMAGFPMTSATYYLVREDGLWKFDWKRFCANIACSGNPTFDF